jgi:hypothetical protein
MPTDPSLTTNTIAVNSIIHEDYDVVATSENPVFLSVVPGAGKPASILVTLADTTLPLDEALIVHGQIGLCKDLVDKTLRCTVTVQAFPNTNDQGIVTFTLEGGKKTYSSTLQQPIVDGIASFIATFDIF